MKGVIQHIVTKESIQEVSVLRDLLEEELHRFLADLLMKEWNITERGCGDGF